MQTRWLLLAWTLAAAWLGWWAVENPLPDGFQNEYLHMGNALDLWGALVALDQWHLRWFAYTGYWPFGFYVLPWPLMALLGPGRAAMLGANLVHLAVLLWGARRLGRDLGAPLAPLLVLLCPATFGSLVRYEPNLANLAWVTAGVACLVASRGGRDRAWVLGWGACLGVGLMLDRLTVGFFLVPAALPLLWRPEPRALRNLAWGGGLALLLTVAWYREFFLRHSEELLSQAPVGEIDAAGALYTTGGPLPVLYYPLSLLDSQAGPVLGGLMLWGLGAVGWRVARGGLAGGQRAQAVVLAGVLIPFLFFTLVAKKQVYYTLPALGLLAALAGTRRGAWLGLLGGLWAFSTLGLGLPTRGGPWLPEAWVYPRHTLARPPTHQDWPLDEVAEAMGPEPGGIGLVSEDQTLYEGFVQLAVRERWPEEPVRAVVLDPVGTYESLGQLQTFLWVGERGGGWPSESDLEGELRADHYELESLPPVVELVVEAGEDFEEIHRAGTEDVDLVVYRRRAPAEEGGPERHGAPQDPL